MKHILIGKEQPRCEKLLLWPFNYQTILIVVIPLPVRLVARGS